MVTTENHNIMEEAEETMAFLDLSSEEWDALPSKVQEKLTAFRLAYEEVPE